MKPGRVDLPRIVLDGEDAEKFKAFCTARNCSYRVGVRLAIRRILERTSDSPDTRGGVDA